MIGILGAGFGLYGHLPALSRLGLQVGTLRRYEQLIAGREELSSFAIGLTYFDSDEAVISASDGLVLARRPADNETVVRKLLEGGRALPRLVIEKPIAANPALALSLHEAILWRGGFYFCPYIFLYCGWADKIRAALKSGAKTIEIDWCMKRGNELTSWKYDAAAGGGVLAYYCIHLLALFVEQGFAVKSAQRFSNKEIERLVIEAVSNEQSWLVQFSLGTAPPAFDVCIDGNAVATASSPFGETPKRGTLDPRVEALESFHKDAALNQNYDREEIMRTHRRILDQWAFLSTYARP